MKINKKIKIAVGSILGIVLLLFVVLVVHIATAKPVVYDNASLQLSRIDFTHPIDSLTFGRLAMWRIKEALTFG